MSAVFGGSKSKSSSSSNSSNQAYPSLSAAFSPVYGQAQTGANSLAALLGGDASGLQGYEAATGYDATKDLGLRNIVNTSALGGSLTSGATLKALQGYGSTLNNQYATTYMDGLKQQAQMGFDAGNTVAGTGALSSSTSKGSSSSKPGLGQAIGQIGASVAAG